MHISLNPSFKAGFLYLACFLLVGCSAAGSTGDEKRQAILDMRADAMSELYSAKPPVKDQVKAAPGYAVFSNANVNLILASFAGGYGVVEETKSGQKTYMKMGEVGIGFGLGVKDYRIVFVFHTQEALDYFVTHGWSFGAQGDAAAKAGDKGGAVGGELLVNNVSIYQMTESGLALQATIKGTRFWPDGNLN